MRVALATVGTRGDVQPMLALAQELVRRGHSAVVACPETFGGWIRGHGVEHQELGEDLQAQMAAGGKAATRAISGMKAYFAEQMLLQAPRLLEIANGADVILGTAMAWTAPSVAAKLGIAALELLPSSCAPSRLHPPPLMPLYGLPQTMNGLLWWLNDRLQNSLMGGPLNAARARLDLPPLTSFTDHLFVDTPAVIAADEQIFPPDPAWNGRYPYAGFLYLDDPAPLDAALEAWLARGEPPVYVGFGSMAGGHPERVATVLVDAMRACGRRCLVSSGAAKLFRDSSVPDDFYVVGDVPHAQLFPRVAVAVHHGGAGTTGAALRAGVPQVLLPMMLDQFHHAHHLVRAGLAPRAPRMAKVTAQSLARAIDEALALPVAPRREAAERLQRTDARNAVIGRLERMSCAN